MQSSPAETFQPTGPLPSWVPDQALAYLAHACGGQSLRDVAIARGCAPSTVLRQVRRMEARRDDPVIDDVLERLAERIAVSNDIEGAGDMSAMPSRAEVIDDETLSDEARRVLRRLCEGDAFLVVGAGMDQAVVLRGDGDPTRLATLSRAVAQAFVLKDWVSCFKAGRVTRYRITDAGRAALRRLMAETLRRKAATRGRSEAPSPFLSQHGGVEDRPVQTEDGVETLRVNLAESPLGALARRRDRDGRPFLTPDLVMAADLLREDFEKAQMGPRTGQDWDRFLTAGVSAGLPADAMGGGSDDARTRVSKALRALGPGLGDVVLRVCCYLEGVEMAEKRMGWSARSGKIVLRIALQRLQMHFAEIGRM